MNFYENIKIEKEFFLLAKKGELIEYFRKNEIEKIKKEDIDNILSLQFL